MKTAASQTPFLESQKSFTFKVTGYLIEEKKNNPPKTKPKIIIKKPNRKPNKKPHANLILSGQLQFISTWGEGRKDQILSKACMYLPMKIKGAFIN